MYAESKRERTRGPRWGVRRMWTAGAAEGCLCSVSGPVERGRKREPEESWSWPPLGVQDCDIRPTRARRGVAGTGRSPWRNRCSEDRSEEGQRERSRRGEANEGTGAGMGRPRCTVVPACLRVGSPHAATSSAIMYTVLGTWLLSRGTARRWPNLQGPDLRQGRASSFYASFIFLFPRRLGALGESRSVSPATKMRRATRVAVCLEPLYHLEQRDVR